MQNALILDAKFWRVATFGPDMATFWGRVGTFGRSRVLSHAGEAAAEKAATALLRSKLGKGYQEVDAPSAFAQAWYFDDPEEGLHRLTSHPRFADAFTEDLFYDCSDEESPFGSDTGNDTQSFLEEEARKRKRATDFAGFPEKLSKDWGMPYSPPGPLDPVDARAAVVSSAGELPRSSYLAHSDQVVVATAFGQAKITGGIDAELGQRALVALDRLVVIFTAECEHSGRTSAHQSEGFALMRQRLSEFLNN